MRSFATVFLAAAASTLVGAQTPAATCEAEDLVSNNIPQPSGAPNIDACAESLPLGTNCGADEQCMNDAQCWGSNAFTIRQCGNFNAACEDDSQCAYNTCNNGLCNGFLATTTTAAQTTATPLAGSSGAGYGNNATQPYGTTGASGAYPSSTGIMQQPVGSGATKFAISGSIVAVIVAAFAGVAALSM